MLILAIFIVLLPATFAHKTNCYICSYSPRDTENWTRLCKDEEFGGNLVATNECEYGCETSTHTDSNGMLEQIRRTCAPLDSGIAYGTCETRETPAVKSVRCVCNSNLCNAASTLTIAIILYTMTILILIFHPINF